MNDFYTDLAMESGRVGQGLDAPGINVARERRGEIERVRVDVLDEEGAREVGKRPGTYTTLYSPAPESGEAWDILRDTLAEEVRLLGGLDDDMQGSVLVVGLGNRKATPDAVGPRAVDRILCTRALKAEAGLSGLREVTAIAPGVYGQTGVDVGELVGGLVKELRPALIIALDALCAREPGRITRTVQLTDAGIQPGSGVGNHRAALSREALGVPVVAIGVPTVVYARSIVADALSRAGGDADACACVEEDMIVTPRDIDALVKRASRLLADALNRALQPRLSAEELRWLTI